MLTCGKTSSKINNSMGTLLKFPDQKTGNQLPKNIIELRKKIFEERKEIIEEAADHIHEMTVKSMYSMGLYPAEPDEGYDKSLMLLYEATRSIICKSFQISHPLQEMADDIFTPDEDQDIDEEMLEDGEEQ